MSKLEILACDATEFGLLYLRRRRLLSQPDVVVTDVTLDHELLMSSFVTVSEKALASIAIEMHGASDLKVLVGGLGLGYTAHEALASDRVARVEVVEYLAEIIGWLDAGLIPLAGELNADGRLTVVRGDVYARLAASPGATSDVIIVDVDHSPEEHLGGQSETFYTEAGLRRAAAHLSEDGILGIWSYAEDSSFADALRKVFSKVRVEPIRVMNELIDEEQTDWLFFAQR